MKFPLQSFLINARGAGGFLRMPTNGTRLWKGPSQIQRDQLFHECFGQGDWYPWAIPLLLETVKPWLKDHEDKWEGTTQLQTSHLCSFPLNGFLGVHSPRLLMTINDTWKAKSQEETAEAFLSQEHLFSSMCTDLLWRTFKATSSELPVSAGRGFLLCLVVLPLACIYHKLKMKQTLLLWGSDQDSRNKRTAECRNKCHCGFLWPSVLLAEAAPDARWMAVQSSAAEEPVPGNETPGSSSPLPAVGSASQCLCLSQQMHKGAPRTTRHCNGRGPQQCFKSLLIRHRILWWLWQHSKGREQVAGV